MRKIVTKRWQRQVIIPDQTYRHVKTALQFAWTTIRSLRDFGPELSTQERNALLEAAAHEAVVAYFELQRTKVRSLKYPLKLLSSDPIPRLPRYWENRHLTR